MKNLTTDNIVDINGDKWIVSHRHKTNVPYQVKLMDVPLQIIERYKHLQEDKFVFGKLNYWSICKKLKKVISACGIEKQISLHCGRHSWATLALSKGMPIENVSRVLNSTHRLTTLRWHRTMEQRNIIGWSEYSDYRELTIYNFEVVLLLAFRLNTYQARTVRKELMERISRDHKPFEYLQVSQKKTTFATNY